MAGIYIHIPFCRRKCHYCNFFSLASQKLKESYLQTLKKEVRFRANYLDGEPVSTIYFGGGTPSLYDPLELQEIIEMMRPLETRVPDRPDEPSILPAVTSQNAEHAEELVSSREITLEINPDDINASFISRLKQTSFNRFSIGIQSFIDEDLAYLNRSHSADQAIQSVRLLQEAGYENLSIDLIYGIPSSSNALWIRNLETAFSLGVPHISAYALTVEQKTPLAWMIEKKKSPPVDDETQVEQFRMLTEKTKEHGYLNYEISNFCKPGWYARHNTSYWNGIPYLGLGPSAHSYNGISRQWNISNLTKYIEQVEQGECAGEGEILTSVQKYNEYVMTSLRTMWGCDEKRIYDFGFAMYDLFRKNASILIGKGLLKEDSGVYFLTDEGKLFADRVASELFMIENT